jgi:hypothetical protein
LLSKLKSIRFQAKPYLSNFVSIPTFCLSQSTCDICKQPVSQSKCSICKATCLSIYMSHLRATVSQSTCDCDRHICKQLVCQALQAMVTSSAFCKQLISQDLYVIVTTYNLQLTTLMHVQNMLHKIKAPKDCSIRIQPQPVPDSNLGQVQSLAT